MARRASLIGCLVLLFTFPLPAAVTGRVVDEDGKPLAGARVRVRALETTDQATDRMTSKSPEPQWLETAGTKGDGIFRIDTKSNAVVSLTVDAPGREFLEQDVIDGEDAGTFSLRKSTTYRGRVTADGKPVAGAVVLIQSSFVVKTDDKGSFECPLPDGGSDFSRITVIHPDYVILNRALRDGARSEPSLDVALKSGSVVRGRVVDIAGRAVAGAVIRTFQCPTVRSGEDGSFEIAHAPSAKPSLYAREGNRAAAFFIDSAKPPYVITLRPAATITGTVRNSKDESPVAGARVGMRADGLVAWAPSVISDAKGNFAIDGLDAAMRRLFATHPAFSSSPFAEVRLEEGMRANRVVYMTPYARLIGKVIDDDQKPVAAARIGLVGAGVGSATTAPDGTFSLRLPSVERGVSVSVQRVTFALAFFGPYTLAPGETKSGLQYRLTRGHRFEVGLVDRDGVPIAGEPVTLSGKPEPNRFMRMPVPCESGATQCESDEQGRVRWVIGDGMHDLSAGGKTTVRLDLQDQAFSAQSSPMTLTLDRGATVEGRVVWSDGSPLNGEARVSALASPEASTAATNGVFSMRNVPPGKVTLVAEAAVPLFTRSEPVEIVAPANNVTLKLPRAGRIEGRVVDGDKAVREFTIMMQQPGMRGRPLPPKTLRADDGKFLIDEVSPGAWEIRVQATGFTRSNLTSVNVEEGKTANATITLDRGGRIIGRVTSEGRPLAEVQILIPYTMDSRTAPSPAMTDPNGEYVLDGVPAGPQHLEARRSGYVTKSFSATATPPQETRADVEMERGRDLRGRVVDAAGHPVPAADVSMRGRAYTTRAMTTSDGDGAFKLTGLGDAVVNLVAYKAGFAESSIDVNPAVSNDITITLSRGGTVTGRILGVPQSELQSVMIRSGTSQATIDANGAFTLTGVADGEVFLHASRMRPPRRDITARVTVAGGTAPPVDLDFGAGIAVRGRVTHRRQFVEGSIRFMPATRDLRQPPASGGIGRDGTYEVYVPAAGEYEVRISRMSAGEAMAGRVSVTGEMTHDIELRGATLNGIVLDATTRQPIPNAMVVMTPGMGMRTSNTGRFTYDLLADGKYRVSAQAWGRAPESRAFEVVNGNVPEIELALSRGVDALFRITDAATGQLLEVMNVYILDSSKTRIYEGDPAPDAAGMRTVQLQPGVYELRCYTTDYVPKPFTLTVPGPPLDVKLERVKR